MFVPVYRLLSIIIILLISFFYIQTSSAECDKRSLTQREQAFFQQVHQLFETALTAPEGWLREESWQYVPESVCIGFENQPLQYGGQFKFRKITGADRIQAETIQRQQMYGNKIQDAISRDDRRQMNRLQNEMELELSDSQSAQNFSIPQKNQDTEQIIAKFVVNETRRAIGKKFEINVNLDIQHKKNTSQKRFG